ncbi:MAG: CHAT domain-containing protein [Cyanobacteria bacterium P01_F01_bin.150]
MGKRYKLALISVLTAVFCIVALPAIAHLASNRVAPSRPFTTQAPSSPSSLYPTAQGLVEQGRDRYEAGQYREAIQLLQQALATYEASGDTLQQAIALSNLSLAHQQLGNWRDARTTIETSLSLLTPLTENGKADVMAQSLMIQGKLQFSQGQFRDAVETWKQAATYYRQAGDQTGIIKSQFNQTQALQSMGFYQQAIDQLTEIRNTLAAEPDSPTKVSTLHSLGNALRIAGILAPSSSVNTEIDQKIPNRTGQNALQPDATTILDQALVMAKRFELDQAIADIYLSQGDVQRAKAFRIQDSDFEFQRQVLIESALNLYQQAIDQSPSASTQIDARLKKFHLLLTENDEAIPWQELQPLRTQIQLQFQSLPPSRTSIYQRVDLAQELIRLKQKQIDTADSLPPSIQLIQWTDIATLLATANQQAESLGDARVQAQVLGTLGTVYIKAEREEETDVEKQNRRGESLYLTQQALQLAQRANADEITYRWYWQLAQLRRQGNDREGAIAAYDQAIQSLKVLRQDLAAVDRNVQFSFRDTTEPIHRELVELLLEPNKVSTSDKNQKDQDLEKARQTIEDLQLAELDNFFRESCLNANDVNIDEVDSQAAVIYPIILSDRLEVILSLPQPTAQTTTNESQPDSLSTKQTATDDVASNKPSRSILNSASPVSTQEIENTTRLIRSFMTQRRLSRGSKAQLQQNLKMLYDWLLAPFAEELEKSGVKTLVFVLDGALRSIPMATLFDGDRYLLETYSIALAPGIQLTESAPPNVQELEVFMGGLSEIPEDEQDFTPLPNVNDEFDQIGAIVASSQQLLNERFTERTIQDRISATSAPVVHLATHGEFGPQVENTFILAWDTRLNINEVSTLLQSSELNRRRPIELLVLSACKTASGDSRASLGLAGMAVRSGARSTLASLWTVDDASTSQTMAKFYDVWVNQDVTKAEALRQAQLSLLNDPDPNLNVPYYWAPFVLLGNWL